MASLNSAATSKNIKTKFTVVPLRRNTVSPRDFPTALFSAINAAVNSIK